METFIKGDIIVLNFPFSDLTNVKKRPALVLANLAGNDLILLMITSILRKTQYRVRLDDNNIKDGSLKRTSFIRCDRIFIIDSKRIDYKVGNLKTDKLNEVIKKIVKVIND